MTSLVPRKLLGVERARDVLAKCKETDEVREIRDQARAVELYLRSRKASIASQQDAAEIRLRAERRLGELTSALPKRTGGQAARARSSRATEFSIPPTLAERGIRRYEAAAWQALAAIPERKFEAYVEAAREKGERITARTPVKLHREEEKDRKATKLRKKPLPPPDGRFDVIVADPPWLFDKRQKDTTQRGRPGYPQMSADEICRLPVSSFANADCILWLWVTNAHLVGPRADVHEVLEAWGFEGKTMLTWVKDRMGMGDWLRGKTEHAILAVRGRPLVRLSNQTTAITGNVREHSRKPESFYKLVEALCPGTKLELFAREPRKGWRAWGAEPMAF